MRSNEKVLLAAYRSIAKAVDEGRGITPAAEWVLDNYHVIEEQIREIREDLPPQFYRQLPKLTAGPFAGFPRVFGIAWAFVAHTDSRFEPEMLCRFLRAYQEVQPLSIGELWAVAITLRIVLIENLRRIAERSKRVVWLNPEGRMAWGFGDSEMPRYATFCSVVRQCATAKQLERAVSDIVATYQ